ncbi:MAG TPA: ABC transporter permease [Gemmatimonadales bacterium]|nr:ABC transporter permease [Gemmatimonadales bacterium]
MAFLELDRLLAVARKEWRQLRRDVRSLLLAFGVPLQLLLLFGYAISWDVRDIPTAVLDQDHSQASRALVDAFRSAGYFRIVQQLASPADAQRALAGGGASVVLVIPVRFSASLQVGRPASVQLLLDGSDANTATVSLGYANAIVASWSPKTRIPVTPSGVQPETRVWYNEDLESRKVLVPGLVAMIMMMIGSLLTSMTIAREWERGSMEQLAATPIRPREIVLGKLLPYLGIGMADVAFTITLGALLFHVPFRGNPLTLLVSSVLFLTGMCGVGIAISAVAKSQRLAVQLSMLLTYLPGMILSGATFDISTMPRALQLVSWGVPARYFVVILRGVLLKGVGVADLWFPILAQVAFALIALTLALHAFRKELA